MSYTLRDNFITQKMGDELYLIPLKKNVAEIEGMLSLNESAAYLLEKMMEGESPEEVSRTWQNNCDLHPALITQAVLKALNVLKPFIREIK